MKRAEAGSERFQQDRDAMERQLNQLVRLVDDLLDVSRITRNRLELRRERVELASVIRQAVENCRPLAEAQRHEVTVDLPDEAVPLDADPVRLTQVFANLLNNALQVHRPPGGNVWITADPRARRGDREGEGHRGRHPAGRAHQHLRMFTQVDRSLERAQGGLGIGLTLVKQLVEMHGGTVEAFSEGPGRGSEFVVRLPVAERRSGGGGRAWRGPARRGRRRGASSSSTTTRTRPCRLPTLLALGGHETRTAHDGAEALDVAESFRPEVVLLDIGLPGLNGYEAARRIRQQPWGRGHAAGGADRLGAGRGPAPFEGSRVRRPPGQAGEAGSASADPRVVAPPGLAAHGFRA